ncbi:protoporphyrinogen oxidase [soil metagenome]
MNNKKIAVIGAGITGLTACFQLKKRDIQADLFDIKGEPGGVIKSVQNKDWSYEYGPNTLLLKDPEIEDFLSDLNLEDEIAVANTNASKRYIVKNGKLHELPTSFSEFFKTPLFSSNAKLRLFGEPFYRKSDEDATLAQFFEHRLGKEILDYAVNPFVAGIHAGRPENLSFKHSFPALHDLEQQSGSIMMGAVRKRFKNKKKRKTKRRLISFTNGLQQLPKTIYSKLDHTYLNHEVKQVKKSDDGWVLKTQMGNFGPYHDIILTVPMHKWNRQLLPLNEQDLDIINRVKYPSLSIMILGYKKEQISHLLDGFGFLVPEKEQRSILGALFTSTLFSGRAPEGHHLLTVFIGGDRQPELAQLNSEELLNTVESDLKDLTGLKGSAVFKDHIYWPNSIPQYHKSYDEVIDLFEELETRNPGLHLAGNFRGGVSVPDCIKNAIKVAEKVNSLK